MSSSRRKFVMRHPEVVDIGCGCRRSKLSSLFSILTKPMARRTPPPFSPSVSTTSHRGTSLTTTSSYVDISSPSPAYTAAESPMKSTKKKKKWVVEDSEVVVKDSSDPYLDFRDSMLLMIVEKEIYAVDELRDLLHRFLALNSPYHHHLILRAFAEIWNGIFSPPSPAAAAADRTFRRW